MNIDEAVKYAAEVLSNSNIPDARREAVLLLALGLKKGRTYIFAHPEYVLGETELSECRILIDRRSAGEPYHYIAGSREFYGLEFAVSPAVLIPRPETEMLVAKAIDLLADRERPRFLEIGGGSGCIAVSILANVKNAAATAVDVSADALSVAASNASKHKVDDRIDLILSDVYAKVEPAKFDLIVSNPPYVPAAEIDGLQSDVRDFEPLAALTDGGSGVSIIERIIDGAPDFLKSKGFILIEIGFGQGDAVLAMFDPALWSDTEIIPDFQSIPRMVRARLG